MSSSDAPPRKRPRNDPLSKHRAEIAYLQSHPTKVLNQDTDPAAQRKEYLSTVPDFVNSVQGSSSGAGSGEFHVYKASRRRENERLAAMDAENRQEREAREFEEARREQKRADDERTRKNRVRRERQKATKAKAIQAEKERKSAAAAAAANANSDKGEPQKTVDTVNEDEIKIEDDDLL